MIYLFKSTRSVISAEKIIAKSEIKYKIIPVPRSISSECGMGIESSVDNETEIDGLLNRENIVYSKHYDYIK